jgi:integrase
MGAFTFHLELKPPTSRGLCPLRVRITKDKVKAYINLGIHLKTDPNPRKSEWNPAFDYRKDNYITSKHPNADVLNQEIRLVLNELELLKVKHHDKTSKELKQVYERGEAERVQTVWEYLDERIELKRSLRQYGPAKTLYQIGVHFKSFSEGVPDSEVFTRPHITRFAAHLQLKLVPITVKTYLNALQGAHRAGVLEGILPSGNPFEGINVHAPAKKQPRPLAHDLLNLYDVPLENGREYHARNFILVLFLLHGARANEGLRLTWADVSDQYVSYLPSKRATVKKHVPHEGLLKEILSRYPRRGKYVFPFLTEADDRLGFEAFRERMSEMIRFVNYHLKAVCKRLGMEAITTHQARRSFTDQALGELSDLREAQGLIGHKSMQTTEHYALEVQREKIDAASRRVLGGFSRGTTGEPKPGIQPEMEPVRRQKNPRKGK